MYSDTARRARELLDSYGYREAELILNEWNYVRGWTGDDIVYSHLALRSLKGSAFIASSLIEAQKSPLDHFMYYEACQASTWNGLFDRTTAAPLKGYWSMICFDALKTLGREVKSGSDCADIRALAALGEDGREAAIMITYYKDHYSIDGSGAEGETQRVRIEWDGFACDAGTDAEYLMLDGSRDLELTSFETFTGCRGGHILDLPLYSTALIKLKKA